MMLKSNLFFIKISVLFLFIGINQSVISQDFSSLTNLAEEISESSGLIYLDNRLITHNDSGNKAELYEIDKNTGEIIRTVKVKNATNVDWEAITQDGENIYIGDIGNNGGNRKNLCVYKISIDQYLNTNNDVVYADKISYNYGDQTNFSNFTYQHNYDAEAIIAFRDSLYIFTKNWKNFKSRIYALPKIKGDYTLNPSKTFETQFLVTDATYNPYTNTILIVGYGTLHSYLLSLNDLTFNSFYNAKQELMQLEFEDFHQIEAITYMSKTEYYLTCEKTAKVPAQLFKLKFDSMSLESEADDEIKIYYNADNKSLYINKDLFENGEIYNLSGQKVLEFTTQNVNLDYLASGLHFTYLTTKEGRQKKPFKFVIF